MASLRVAVTMDLNGLLKLVKAQLSPSELEDCVVYLLPTPAAAGSTIGFPGGSISVPRVASVAFIDLLPLANFGHPCRYVVIESETGETRSTESRFPPFRPSLKNEWRVVYKSPGVPDSVLMAPKQSDPQERRVL
jgi:hypothetical protein